MGKSALPSIILLVLLCHVGAASGQNVQMTVSAVVPADSSSALTIRKMRSQAIGVAQRAVWQNLKAREEFRKLVYNFQQQQDEAMISRLEVNCSPPIDVSQEYDKKTRLLSYRFIFSCNHQVLLRDATRLNARIPGVANAEPRARLTYVFFSIKDESIEEFDDTVRSSGNTSVKVGSQDQTSESSSSDERNQKGEKTDFFETSGKISEQVISRSKSDSQRSTQSSTDSGVTVRYDSETGGSRLRRRARVSRSVVSAQEIQRALIPIMQRERFSVVPYGTVSSRCGATPFEDIQEEIRTLPPDYPLAVRDATRDKVLQATANCRVSGGAPVSYFMEGYAKIGMPRLDPATGEIRVSVNVSQTIYDATTGEELTSTAEQQVFGSGEDEAAAVTNALGEAAESVGLATVAALAGRGI